ncbi:TetR/AcrR family transcriptional regulator [Burkholderia sp. Bp8963]|uniref:TetR/AcrR family transcriptional regulator n=1 Tax=Burkholderia sp. Bp8963 TaxID=2184547 RepID=UPI000F5B5AB7|nr:TetR/AcrR family transcriptional regulator [Burkholderia sp. Bp8963]RQS72022.1 TetR/AcrR family transcriptional regulator [Burkholderia sp. Bp8963]
MRYKAGHKEEARSRILDAAGRGFRRLGFGGIGVDGLAKEAGVTSGAFYGHFPSKADAFKAAAVAGLVQLREAIEHLRDSEGDAWLGTFVDFYMSVRRTCELGESCALQSLTPEVARAGDDTKTAYEAELLAIVDAVALGLPDGTLAARRKTAWAILSILSGGVSIARSTADPKTGAQIAAGIKDAVNLLVGKR